MTGVVTRQEYGQTHGDTERQPEPQTVPQTVRQIFIEKVIYLDAPVAEVWLALVDPNRFGEWFRTKLDKPFRVNEYTHGTGTYPGCEHLRWRAVTEALDHERLLAFTWWPAPDDVPFDESALAGTLVEITLRATVDGTRVIFRESGFERIADEETRSGLIAVRTQGWGVQASNLRHFIDVS